MKVNWDSPILDLYDKPLTENNQTVTLGSLVMQAMLMNQRGDESLTGDQKVARFKIALSASKGGEADLRAEDITMIKQVVAKAFTPLPVARCYELLDPKGS